MLTLVLSIDENDPDALAAVGWAKAYLTRDFGAATEMLDRAVALNPNSAVAWNYRGVAYQFMGQAEEALRSFERGIRLNPLDPMLYGTFAVMGFAFISLRRFDEAVAAAKKSLRKNKTFGAVAELVGNEGGVVSGVFNLESSGVEASDWRPRHDEHYHEA